MTTEPRSKRASTPLEPNPEWYRDGVIYEVHVRAFKDSNGDGVGDFDGLRSKLDHLVNLGVTALWLLPFYSARSAGSSATRTTAGSA
jgi:maltose alpha-D-glucosyltransferase/alpha-amylase